MSPFLLSTGFYLLICNIKQYINCVFVLDTSQMYLLIGLLSCVIISSRLCVSTGSKVNPPCCCAVWFVHVHVKQASQADTVLFGLIAELTWCLINLTTFQPFISVLAFKINILLSYRWKCAAHNMTRLCCVVKALHTKL